MDNLPPLEGLLSPESHVTFLDAPEEVLDRIRNDVGSVAFDESEEIFAATSPHGGQVLLWSIAEGKLLDNRPASDVHGTAASGDRQF